MQCPEFQDQLVHQVMLVNVEDLQVLVLNLLLDIHNTGEEVIIPRLPGSELQLTNQVALMQAQFIELLPQWDLQFIIQETLHIAQLSIIMVFQTLHMYQVVLQDKIEQEEVHHLHQTRTNESIEIKEIIKFD